MSPVLHCVHQASQRVLLYIPATTACYPLYAVIIKQVQRFLRPCHTQGTTAHAGKAWVSCLQLPATLYCVRQQIEGMNASGLQHWSCWHE